MKIFLSWSGDQSRRVAETFHSWLPKVNPKLEPWLSADILKGRRWSDEVSKALDTTSFGMVCLTPESLSSDWVLFEVGALSKTVKEQSHVCTYLLSLKPTDVTGPLGTFQHTTFDQKDTHRLMKMMNACLGPDGHPAGVFDDVFEKWWPDLERGLKEILSSPYPAKRIRSDREILEEVLQGVRALQSGKEAESMTRVLRFFEDPGLSDEEMRNQVLQAAAKAMKDTKWVHLK